MPDLRKFWIVGLALVGVLSPNLPFTTPAETELILGVFPRRTTELTQNMYTPLTEYLSEKLGRRVKLETANDFPAFWQRLSSKHFDIVHFNQYHYIRAHKEFGYQIFAQNEEEGSNQLAAAIIVRKDSNIHSLHDLKGKKIAFGGGRSAMLAYIGATYILRQNRLAPGDYMEEYALNPEKACIAVFYRQAAAAGAGHQILSQPSVKQVINTDELRYLTIGESMAHLPWAIHSRLDKELAARISQAMLQLHEHERGRAMLTRMYLTRILAASDADYDAHRRIVQHVLHENW